MIDLQRLVELWSDAVLVVDRRGSIAVANRRAEDLFGYPTGGLMGLLVECLLPESMHEGHVARRAAFAARPRARRMGEGQEIFARRRDGSKIEVEVRLGPLTGDGADLLILASVRGVRARRGSAPATVGLCVVDAKERAVMTSRPLQEMLGYSAEEIQAMRFTDYTHPDDVAESLRLWQEVFDGKRDGYELEKRYVRKGGGVFWARLTVQTVRDDEGALVACLSTVEDISARKALEAKLPGPQLTARQLEVLELLSQGLGTDAIAAALGISRATVRNHVRMILVQLGSHSRLEAVTTARRLGLV